MTKSDVLEAWGVQPITRFGAMSAADVLKDYCWYGRGLCTRPIKLELEANGSIVGRFKDDSATALESTSSFTYLEGRVSGLPPASLDQANSQCDIFDLRSDASAFATRLPVPSTDPIAGVSWQFTMGNRTSVVYMTWSPLDVPGPLGQGAVVSTATVDDAAAIVFAVEGGFVAEFSPDTGCGRYTLWSYQSDESPEFLSEALSRTIRKV
jgi:hypothetical protein